MAGREPIHLIVNADDYGYFPSISRGIVDAARAGALTATGVLANSPGLPAQLKELKSLDNVDFGVHLNLSYGQPLTTVLAEKFSRWNGCFPGAYRISLMILAGVISVAEVRAEWQAQIEACRGLRLRFLNSHEHVHMLPVLFPVALELAKDYRIAHLRVTRADWHPPMGVSGLIRNTLMLGMQSLVQIRFRLNEPMLIGLSQSGKLGIDYLEQVFRTLQPGKTYELMCHPGYFDSNQISDSRLISYHEWEKELTLLKSPELMELYANHGVCLSRYKSH